MSFPYFAPQQTPLLREKDLLSEEKRSPQWLLTSSSLCSSSFNCVLYYTHRTLRRNYLLSSSTIASACTAPWYVHSTYIYVHLRPLRYTNATTWPRMLLHTHPDLLMILIPDFYKHARIAELVSLIANWFKDFAWQFPAWYSQSIWNNFDTQSL
jgi:hypothetical protein